MTSETLKKLDKTQVKSALIYLSSEDIKKICLTEEKYNKFVRIVLDILSTEPAFFLLSDEFMKKTEEVLVTKRFELKKGQNSEVINDVITNFNKLKALSEEEKKIQRTIYCKEQENLREHYFFSQVDLLNSIGQDFIILGNLATQKEGEAGALDLMRTLNYTAKTIPEYFEEYPYVKVMALSVLDTLSKQKGLKMALIRRKSKKTIANIQKVKTKEE